MKAYGVLLVSLMLTGCAENSAIRHRTGSTTPAPVYAGAAERGVIPAGTTVEVRSNEAINADSAAEGRTYSAEITRDIVGSDGNLLIPRGSPAQLAVANVTDPGAVTSGQIELALRSITVNGRNYLVASDTESTGERGLGANRRTAEMVGGGALLGTLIGAVAGGGTGAAIGAVVGAGAGAAAQVLTKGKEVRVPAESILTFRLDQPLRLQNFR